MNFDILESQVVFKGRVFNVRVDKVRFPNGRVGQIDLLEHAGAVTVLPTDESGQVWFIRQHRHPAGADLLELPAGVMDDGEEPAFSAQRELREEIGMAANQLSLLGEFYLAPGYSTEYMYVFWAAQLVPAPLAPDEDEQIEVVKVPVQEIPGLVKTGQIRDAKSLAALYLWKTRSKSD